MCHENAHTHSSHFSLPPSLFHSVFHIHKLIHSLFSLLGQVRYHGKKEEVCATAFGSLYGVTQARVRRLATESTMSTCAPLDKRGKHSNRPRKIPDIVCQQIDRHVRSFPAMKSHYSRKKVSCRRSLVSLKCMSFMCRNLSWIMTSH